MYQSTTPAQVARTIAMWLLVVGGIGLFLMGRQLATSEDRTLLLIDLAALAIGISLFLWARWRLRSLDTSNRPYLLAETGATVMRGREEFSKRVAIASRFALGAFLIAGITFFFLLSAASCGNSIEGYCGDVGTPSEGVMVLSQTVAISVGAVWVALVSLRRTHDKESERIDLVVAEGQRQRRMDHPMTGTDRRSWE